MSLDNRSIAHLRSIILDESGSASRRLKSIDILASAFNAWQTRKIHTDAMCETPERMRQFLVKALRRLLKSDGFKAPTHNSAIRARLLFLSGTTIGTQFYRNTPALTERPAQQPTKPPQSQTLRSIAATLAEYEKQQAGGHQ